MTDSFTGKSVLVCDTQPVAVQGIQRLLERSGDLQFAGAAYSLDAAFEMMLSTAPHMVLLDKSFGLAAVMDHLRQSAEAGVATLPAVWGTGMTEAEALRLLQAGARGVMRRTAEPDTVIS